MQAVWDELFGGQGQIVDSSTIKATRTPRGVVLKSTVRPGGGGAPSGKPVWL